MQNKAEINLDRLQYSEDLATQPIDLEQIAAGMIIAATFQVANSQALTDSKEKAVRAGRVLPNPLIGEVALVQILREDQNTITKGLLVCDAYAQKPATSLELVIPRDDAPKQRYGLIPWRRLLKPHAIVNIGSRRYDTIPAITQIIPKSELAV